MPQLLKFCYSFEPTDGWPNATKCEDPSHWDGGAWLPPAAFEVTGRHCHYRHLHHHRCHLTSSSTIPSAEMDRGTA